MWDKITYVFLNFNGATVEVKEWISNIIPHFNRQVSTYQCWETVLVKTMLVKGAPSVFQLVFLNNVRAVKLIACCQSRCAKKAIYTNKGDE